MGKKKNKNPLTTAFVRQLALESPIEEYVRGHPRATDAVVEFFKEGTEDTWRLSAYTCGSEMVSPVDGGFLYNDVALRAYDVLYAMVQVLYDDREALIGEMHEKIVFLVEYCADGMVSVLENLSEEFRKERYRYYSIVLMQRVHMYLRGLEWQAANKPTYAFSLGLSEMLRTVELDQVPATCFRLPYPVIEIVFPPGLFPPYKMAAYGTVSETVVCPVEGALISDQSTTPLRTEKGSTAEGFEFLVYGRDPRTNRLNKLAVIGLSNNGETITEALDIAVATTARTAPERKDGLQAAKEQMPDILRFLVAGVLYLTASNADLVLGSLSSQYQDWLDSLKEIKLGRHQQEHVAGIRKQVERPNRVYVGQHVKLVDKHHSGESKNPEESGTGRASPRTHWRAAHYHIYWTGPKNAPQIPVSHFVERTWVNMPKEEGVTPPRVTPAHVK
jgi:hypothetical protein